jgi:hypothetical protein
MLGDFPTVVTPGTTSMSMAGPLAMRTRLGLHLLVFSSARFCSIIPAGAAYQAWRGSDW